MSDTLPIETVSTPEAEEIQIKGWLSEVYQSDSIVRESAVALLNLRRSYTVAYGILHARVNKIRELNPGLPLDIVETLAKVMGDQAAKEFDPKEVIMALGNSTLPFLDEQLRIVLNEEEVEVNSIMDEKEKQRRASPIFCPIFREGTDQHAMSRKDSYVLVVDADFPTSDFSDWFIEKMVDDPIQLKKQTNVVFHASLYDPPFDTSYNYFPFHAQPTSKDEPLCNKLGKLGAVLKEKMSNFQVLPDLLFADNLAAMYKGPMSFRHAAGNAGDAHRSIRKFAKQLGFGMISLLVVNEKEPDLNSPSYENLRNHSFLCRLILKNTNEQVHTIEIYDRHGTQLNTLTIGTLA